VILVFDGDLNVPLIRPEPGVLHGLAGKVGDFIPGYFFITGGYTEKQDKNKQNNRAVSPPLSKPQFHQTLPADPSYYFGENKKGNLFKQYKKNPFMASEMVIFSLKKI
jgi:hypothetical protein